MANFMQQDPLTLDSAVLCLAIMSRDPAPVNEWGHVAESVGAEIARVNKSFAYVFRRWDTDRDGYLSFDELEEGLGQLPCARGFSPEDVASFMRYVESMGITNGRISIFEFVRAVAPRRLSLQLHQDMLREVLKRVWICRPALMTLLANLDPRGTNRVTLGEFRSCLEEINVQLGRRGRPRLSDTQLSAICEIACIGAHSARRVDYDRFIRGLHVVDTGATR